MQEIDDFATDSLNLAWRWNHNPHSAFWSLTERPGFLRLKASTLETSSGEDGLHQPVLAEMDSILFAKNVVSQLIVGKSCIGTTLLDVSKMENGQRAGFCFFNKSYAWIGVIQDNENRVLALYDNSTGNLVKYLAADAIVHEQVWLRGMATQGQGTLLYSLDGENFVQLGNSIPFHTEWFESHSMALFTYNIASSKGHVDFDWFQVKS